MWASKLLLLDDFSAQAEWRTVAKALNLASRMIVTSLMPLIKVSSRCYFGATKLAFMSRWHGKKIIFFLSWKWGSIRRKSVMYRLYQLSNALWHVTPKHSDLKQYPFIHTFAIWAGLSWAGSSLLCVVMAGLTHAFAVSWLVPRASLTCLAIGCVAWFSFAWLLSRIA